MIETEKKLIIFKNDCNDERLKEKCYVKFLDKEKEYAIFYKPLIAPKYFKEYLKENRIEEAYLICDDSLIEEYKDIIYTFKNEKGVYKVSNSLEEEKKLVLMVDKGMEICLNLPKYLYSIKDNKIFLMPYKEGKNKEYCYVACENDVNDILKSIMLEVRQVVPGVLNMDSYELNSNSKKIIKA